MGLTNLVEASLWRKDCEVSIWVLEQWLAIEIGYGVHTYRRTSSTLLIWITGPEKSREKAWFIRTARRGRASASAVCCDWTRRAFRPTFGLGFSLKRGPVVKIWNMNHLQSEVYEPPSVHLPHTILLFCSPLGPIQGAYTEEWRNLWYTELQKSCANGLFLF